MDAQPSEEVYTPTRLPPSVNDVRQAGIAVAKTGEGHLMYCRDMNASTAEEETIGFSACFAVSELLETWEVAIKLRSDDNRY